jgi:hypothetical protein
LHCRGPSLISVQAGDRVETDRRDAVMLAKLHRAGELTAGQFEHPAQQIVFQDQDDAVTDDQARAERLTTQIANLLPIWSLAAVVEAVQEGSVLARIVAVTVVAGVEDSNGSTILVSRWLISS